MNPTMAARIVHPNTRALALTWPLLVGSFLGLTVRKPLFVGTPALVYVVSDEEGYQDGGDHQSDCDQLGFANYEITCS